jgi:hypothetical protein
MPKLTIAKNNFTAGEIAPDLWGRSDLQGYMNGAARLRNVLLRPTGGVTRRPGLRHIARIVGIDTIRLAAFAFNTEQTYLLGFQDGMLRVWRGDEQVFAGLAPWTAAMLRNLSWTQNADTLFLCHPDLPPQRITRHSHSDWTITAFAFALDGDAEAVARHTPMFKFAAPEVTLTPSAASGSIALAASAPVFLATHVGGQFRIKGKALRIDTVSDAVTAQATVLQTLADADATEEWEESAISPARGWPACVTLYQERLVFAGSRDLPNRVWMSKTSAIDNFDRGKGLDDESIDFALLTDQVDAIRAVVAGRHLQLFTTGAEWMVAGDPITPSKLSAQRQTRVGSYADRVIPPRHVDGATLFIARSGRELREFLYTDLDQAYTATDLALLSPHVFDDPVDQDYAPHDRLFLVVMGDGSMAALTVYRAQQIAAWTVFGTNGAFRAVAVVDRVIHVAVERDGDVHVERFVPDAFTDAHITASVAVPQTVWAGLDHLEGRQVAVVGDGQPRGVFTVQNGGIVLPRAVAAAEIGLPYTHEIAPLPPEMGNGTVTSQAAPVRLVRAVFRLHETKALRVDTGRGPRELPFARGGDVLDAVPAAFSGDVEQRGLGWVRGSERPIWQVIQDAPLPCTLLAVISEMKGAD